MKLEAIVLAGGMGTRLRSVVKEVPKPLADISGKPFLHYLFCYLRHFGIGRVVMSVGYRHDMIRSFLDTEYQGIEVCYAIEEEPLGTGGGIKLAMEQVLSDHALILNGDTFFDLDLTQFQEQYTAADADVMLALRAMAQPDRFGTVEFQNNFRITSFREKVQGLDHGYINGGVYLLSKACLMEAELPSQFSIESDFFQPMIDQLGFYAFPSDAYFIDIGIPEEYHRANNEFSQFKY